MSQYQHPLSHYPAVYDVSYRTVLRWAAKSYPLDHETATRALVAAQKNGLARIYGTKTALYDGRDLRTYVAHLKELEEKAKAEKRGGWGF